MFYLRSALYILYLLITLVPWALVAVHVLGSVVVWWATARLLLRTRRRGVADSIPAAS